MLVACQSGLVRGAGLAYMNFIPRLTPSAVSVSK